MTPDWEVAAPTETLDRWWWPGQWLRIVFSVWFDQLWYWQNVRPKLTGRRSFASLAIQTMLGASIVDLFLLTVAIPVIQGVNPQVNSGWLALILAFPFCLAIAIVLLIDSVSLITGKGFSRTLPANACIIPILALWGIPFYLDAARYSVIGSYWDVLLFSFLFGLSLATVATVDEGTAPYHEGIMEGVLAGFVAGSDSGRFLVGVYAFVLFILAYYLGHLWATRQVADQEIREQLADATPLTQYAIRNT